ncbi:dynamin family protein [Pseudonocardia asaccharolytica]|uniref:Isoniazid-inducible protein iniA n=1 Tax=Pseudonocardia asaccharolytica DSM 44247 = NBRC 16224 TaxID=1123024 RepID=A0A511D7W6_9PSEU|nr:dynamin family protein [Pseudonocardia asaccharolytica]GEL20876.1 isoniazid-inducible protein iniA [Pseudonocardia asaccharolytica DSM 44247 = NBRC 16224]
MAVPAAVDLVDLALKATSAYQRPDLGARLQLTRKRLADPNVRVLIVGEFKKGKSQLVNALVNAPVCPVDDDISTAVPTVVRHAETTSVTLVRESATDDDRPPERTDVPIGQLAQYVSEAGNPANRAGLSYAEVGLPRKLLAGGLVLVDTPGVGGLGSAHGAATMSVLPSADAVVLVSDAAQEYTAPELEFLSAAMKLCPNVACVVTKTDLYPHWRRILEIDKGHLEKAGIRADVLPVSSTLRLHAAQTQDTALMEESGFKDLISFLLRKVVARADDLDRRSTAQDVLDVAEQLATSMKAELSAQEDPERAEALVAELTKAKSRADALRQRTARWQTTLNDGVADLISDIDYDLRDRLRTITREAEELLSAADPADIWDQFAEWLHQQVTSAASANFVWTAERARWLAEQVAEHFAEGAEIALPELRFGDTGEMGGKVGTLEQPEDEKFGIGQKLFTGMRGGYGGLLMIGLATSFAGMALLNPLSIGAGLLFGGKTVRDEKRRLMQRRQAEAKNAVRRHIDEVTFQVSKDSRDMMRRIQRDLRDHFTVLAEEVSTSLSGSVAAAQSAVKTETSGRERRIRDLKAELARIDALGERARKLASQSAPTTTAS